MNRNGNKLGRPQKHVEIKKFVGVRKMVEDGLITKTMAAKTMGVAFDTYKKWEREYENVTLEAVLGKRSES